MPEHKLRFHYHHKSYAKKNRVGLLLAVWWLRRRYKEHLLLHARKDDLLQQASRSDFYTHLLRQDPTLPATFSPSEFMEQEEDSAYKELGRRLKRTDELLALEARVRVSDTHSFTDDELERIYTMFAALLKTTCFRALTFHRQRRATWMKDRAPLPPETGLLRRSSIEAVSILIYTGALRAIAPVSDIPLYLGSTYPFDEFDPTLIGLPPRQE